MSRGWNVPKIWEGGECWIIGGGPSMPREFDIPDKIIRLVQSGELPPSSYSPFMEAIHDKHVIAVNSAFMIGDWIDVTIFGDAGWFLKNRVRFSKYRKLKVGCHQVSVKKEFLKDNVRYVQRDGNHPLGISTDQGKVSWNKNTGGAAINLAYHFGVKKIYLLGFDMDVDKGKNHHWHGLYNNRKPEVSFHKHLPCFPHISRDAERLGIEIINVSPNSRIKAFKKVSLKEVLNEGK